MSDPVPYIGNIGIGNFYVRQLHVPSVPITNQYGGYHFPYFTNVVLPLGVPVIELPGCVQAHEESARKNKYTPNLQEDDPNATVTLCPDGQYPTYDAMDYTPDNLQIVVEQPPPEVIPPPDPPGAPETPETGDLGSEEVPCPGPNQPRIGTLGPNEKEKVSGYELQTDPNNKEKQICVILYEDIGIAEQYLPSAQVAATTATIATVAGASALLAKPLADLLLRVFRPAIKQALTKVNAILGRNPYRPTLAEIRTNEYRKKKGQAPMKFGPQKKKKLKKAKEG